jgi:Fe-Mn family superoxide dismutase
MTHEFAPKTFTIRALDGISTDSIAEHMKLYQGYVKNLNTALSKRQEYFKDGEANAYEIGELSRRLSFEWNGMKNHELYFEQLEGEAVSLPDGALREAIGAQWGSFDAWLSQFKTLAVTRGIGWAMLSYDPETKQLINSWVDEQHLGQLNGTVTLLALDMWEHSFVADYKPSGKKMYVDDYLRQMNWEVVARRFEKASS